ncbi:hypothetical protein JCM1841_004466 [Sporobolomyces salmonicolor]
MPARTKATAATSASASATSTVPYVPPATQIIPSVGLDGSAVATGGSTASDNGGNDFPTAAIAVIAIVAGIVGIFVAYKVYVWSYRYCRTADDETPLPETRALAGRLSPQGGTGFVSLPSQLSFAYGGGTDSMGRMSGSRLGLAQSRQGSWGGDSWIGEKGEKGELSPPFASSPMPPSSPISRDGSPGGLDGSRASLHAFPTSSTRNSLAPSFPRRSYASGSQPLLIHSRTSSSFSSGHLLPSGNRISGAPHNPHSRIEVVPPMPLAPPPGNIVATDKSTLDFAPSSGVGRAVGGDGPEEWLDLSNVVGQEKLNPTYDGDYMRAHQQHSFPPSAPSAPSSSASSSSQGQSRAARRRPSQPTLGQAVTGPGAPLSSGATSRPPASASASARVSPNSSESNLTSSSRSRAPPPPPLSLNTSTHSASNSVSTSEDGGESGPRSPLEKLQRRMEREARGLSMQSAAEERLEGGRGSGEARR